MTKKIGIFAGTFDPVHDGHIASAEFVVNQLGLDVVYFMVEKKPWSNKTPVDIKHRIAMVELAVKNNSKLSQLHYEDERFTITHTLQKIVNQFAGDQLYFIIGSDTFLSMNHTQWPELEQLFEHYIVVLERDGISNKAIEQHAKRLGIVVAILPSVHNSHRSTEVRIRPHKRNRWVPKAVNEYITAHKLYDL